MHQPITRGVTLLKLEQMPALPKGFQLHSSDFGVLKVVNAAGTEKFVAFANPPRLIPILREWMGNCQCNFKRTILLPQT